MSKLEIQVFCDRSKALYDCVLSVIIRQVYQPPVN